MATEPVKPSFLDTLGGWVTSAGKIFAAGTDVYVGAKQRIEAIKATDEDTVKQPTATAPKVVTGSPSTWPGWVIPVAAVVGVVVLILIVRGRR